MNEKSLHEYSYSGSLEVIDFRQENQVWKANTGCTHNIIAPKGSVFFLPSFLSKFANFCYLNAAALGYIHTLQICCKTFENRFYSCGTGTVLAACTWISVSPIQINWTVSEIEYTLIFLPTEMIDLLWWTSQSRQWCGWNRMGLRILTPSPTLYITVGHHVLKPICNPEPTFVLSLISKDLEISHMNYWSSLTNVHFRFKIRSHLCHWWTQQIMGIVATTLPIFRNAPLPPLVQRRVSSPARRGVGGCLWSPVQSWPSAPGCLQPRGPSAVQSGGFLGLAASGVAVVW